MKKDISPLALPRSVASASQWSAQALLGFMGTLLLIFALALHARTAAWMNAVETRVLFEIPAVTPASPTTAATDPQTLRDALEKTGKLHEVKILSQKEVADSLRGWIDNTDILPLPTLIEAKMDPDLTPEKLKKGVNKPYPNVIVHVGQQAMADGLQQVILLRFVSYALLIVVLLVGGAMSLTAALWRLDVQEEVIDLLHSMGASRSFLVRDLARFSFVHTLSSAGAGLLCALLLLAVGSLFVDSNPNQIRLLSPLGIGAAILVPLALAILSAFATALAVKARYLPFRRIKT